MGRIPFQSFMSHFKIDLLSAPLHNTCLLPIPLHHPLLFLSPSSPSPPPSSYSSSPSHSPSSTLSSSPSPSYPSSSPSSLSPPSYSLITLSSLLCLPITPLPITISSLHLMHLCILHQHPSGVCTLWRKVAAPCTGSVMIRYRYRADGRNGLDHHWHQRLQVEPVGHLKKMLVIVGMATTNKISLDVI